MLVWWDCSWSIVDRFKLFRLMHVECDFFSRFIANLRRRRRCPARWNLVDLDSSPNCAFRAPNAMFVLNFASLHMIVEQLWFDPIVGFEHFQFRFVSFNFSLNTVFLCFFSFSTSTRDNWTPDRIWANKPARAGFCFAKKKRMKKNK